MCHLDLIIKKSHVFPGSVAHWAKAHRCTIDCVRSFFSVRNYMMYSLSSWMNTHLSLLDLLFSGNDLRVMMILSKRLRAGFLESGEKKLWSSSAWWGLSGRSRSLPSDSQSWARQVKPCLGQEIGLDDVKRWCRNQNYEHQFRSSLNSHSDLSPKSARSNRCKSSNLSFEVQKTRRMKTFQQWYLSCEAVWFQKKKMFALSTSNTGFAV